MASQMYTDLQTHRVGYIKYVKGFFGMSTISSQNVFKKIKKKKKPMSKVRAHAHIFSPTFLQCLIYTRERIGFCLGGFDELMILKLRSRASISNVLWGFCENLGRDVYSVYQSFSPNLPTACTTTLLLFKCSFFFLQGN